MASAENGCKMAMRPSQVEHSASVARHRCPQTHLSTRETGQRYAGEPSVLYAAPVQVDAGRLAVMTFTTQSAAC